MTVVTILVALLQVVVLLTNRYSLRNTHKYVASMQESYKSGGNSYCERKNNVNQINWRWTRSSERNLLIAAPAEYAFSVLRVLFTA